MKQGTIIILILVICLAFTSCFSYSLKESEESISSDYTQIKPQQSEDTAGSDVVLYFRSYNQDYLAGEMRNIPLYTDRMIEETLVKELIKGPLTDSVTQLIPVDTKLVAISKSGEYIYVTLSNEFYDVGSGVPDNWTSDLNWREQVYSARKLAIYSIINTLTELGSYSRVQILIDETGDGRGKRLTMENLGVKTQARLQLLEPIPRDDSYIINPMNTVKQMLYFYTNKQWGEVASMVALHDHLELVNPDDKKILSDLTSENMTITMYRLNSYNVLQNGTSAVVVIDYAYKMDNGKTVEFNDVPIRTIYEDGMWKISYKSLYQIIQR